MTIFMISVERICRNDPEMNYDYVLGLNKTREGAVRRLEQAGFKSDPEQKRRPTWKLEYEKHGTACKEYATIEEEKVED